MADSATEELSSEDVQGRAQEAFSEGLRMLEVEHPAEAVTAFTRALEAYRTLPGTHHQQADCLHNLAQSLREVGQFDQALDSYRQALGLYRQVDGTESQQARCLTNTGVVLDDMGRHEEALAFYQQAQEIYPQPDGGR